MYFDEETYQKLLQEVPHTRLVTVSTIADKLRINGSLARRAIRDLESKGLIKKVDSHTSQMIFTRAVEKPEKKDGPKDAAPAKGGKDQGKGKQQQQKKQPAPKKGAAPAAEPSA